MRFQLTEEQKALRAGMRELLARRFDGAALRAAAEEPRLDRALWRELGAAGFFALRMPEADGGVGLGLPEAVLVFEEAGRALLPGPLVATHLAAGTVPGAASGEAVVTDVDSRGLVEWLSEADVLRGDATAAVPLRSVDPLTPLHRIPGAGCGPGRAEPACEPATGAGQESSVPFPGTGVGQGSSVRLPATDPSPMPGSPSAAAPGSPSLAAAGASSVAAPGSSSVEGAGSSSAAVGGSSSAGASGSAFVAGSGSRSAAVPGSSFVEGAGSSSAAVSGVSSGEADGSSSAAAAGRSSETAPGRSSAAAAPGRPSATAPARDPAPSVLPVSRSPRCADPVAVLLTAAEQLGTATRVCELAVQHAGTREQFGQPIGAFQAVKHLCAQMLVRAETARAAVYAAAVTADPVDVAAARLLADEAAERGARDCLQVHGGMGFTWECEVQLHLKRAWVRARRAGGGAESEELLAVDLLA
ncbi:hypothetical protein QFZ22_005772 [Streptomyces canus]|uniref:Acyl-CoA dehydrogenase n=1 Tax=Streptomyces canus TaxID=58343 RepID=A0AAW8FL52_9ACTN|nr:hypothetical protein [Streptomyces canus]